MFFKYIEVSTLHLHQIKKTTTKFANAAKNRFVTRGRS